MNKRKSPAIRIAGLFLTLFLSKLNLYLENDTAMMKNAITVDLEDIKTLMNKVGLDGKYEIVDCERGYFVKVDVS